MEMYGLKQQKKKKKWWLIPLIIVAAVFVVISAVGIILGSSNADRDAISAAVSENAELKRQIDDLNAQIQSLNEQLAQKQGELDARPTIAPEEPSPTPGADGEQGETSPRNYDE